ncbi:calcium-binding protein [Mesorhizobium sp. M0910]|uniref:calcium-binding protein n=1 Tax=Mesorhizobium sp. M0910 TaxID=2957025 RepID=UPI003339C847
MATLHYTSGGSATEIANAGFNLADVQYASQVDALPDGMKGLVYLNEHEGVTSSFIEKMTPFLGNPNVFGFYLVDEPDPTGRWGTYATAENLKAESDWIHEHFPGAKTFITMMNMGSPTNPDFTNTYNPANTHIDYFGIDPYPVRTGTDTVDYDMIDRAVAAAVKSGIPANNIVPVYQAFGGGNWETSDGGRHVMPTPEQMQTMIDHWAALVPTPGFDYTYKWGTQNGDTALESSSELQAVFREHNLATTGAEPSDTSDGSAAATPPSDAAASDSSSTVTAPSHDATGDNTSTATAPSHDATASDSSSTATASSHDATGDSSSTVTAASDAATGDISSTATAPSDATASDSSSTATAPSHDATGDGSSTVTAASDDAGNTSSTAAASSEAATGDSSSTATVPSTATAADNSSTVAASDSKTSHGTSTATATAIAPSDASTSDSNSAGAATSHRTASHGKATSDASHASASTDKMAGHSGNDTSHVDTGGNKMEDLGSGVDRVLAVLSHALSAGSEFLAPNNHSDRTATNLTGHGFAQTVQSGENVGAQAKNGAAAEIMSGHGGNDAFDFSKLQDKLHLDQAALTELKSSGLSLHASPAGTATDDGSHHIIFDSSTGSLSLDSDAVGGSAQAQLATHLPLQHHSLI